MSITSRQNTSRREGRGRGSNSKTTRGGEEKAEEGEQKKQLRIKKQEEEGDCDRKMLEKARTRYKRKKIEDEAVNKG